MACLVRIAFVVVALVACRDPALGPCRCTPDNVARTKRLGAGRPIDGEGLLALVRRHRELVRADAAHRDIKLVDDEIRLAVTSFCQPCGDWVGDRMEVDEMFPSSRLDDATRAVCLGLELRDGSTAFGDGRPLSCR